MMRLACAALLALLSALPAFAAEPPPIAGDEGATYADLIREGKLVTIMLKAGAPEHNMRILDIHPSASTPTIEVETSSGERTAHTFANIASVRVQRERIQIENKPDPDEVLTADDKAIVDTAVNRSLVIYKETRNQVVKTLAAVIIAASTHANKRDAIAYLAELRSSNDANTSMIAALMLWQVGEDTPDEVLLAGMNSGSRSAKALAATLVGLTKREQFIVELRRLLRDRSVEIFPAAALAIGRLNDRESLPILYDALHNITAEKAEAAALALERMGGDDVLETLQDKLVTAKGPERFRIIRTLHTLGDKNASRLLETESLGEPAQQREAALILAEEGSPEAVKFLRAFLQKQIDPNEENLVYKAQVGLALYEAGDLQAKGVLRDLLAITPDDIYERGKTSDKAFKAAAAMKIQIGVCAVIGESMRRDLLPLLQAPLQSADPGVSIVAGAAVMSIANREFGLRGQEAD